MKIKNIDVFKGWYVQTFLNSSTKRSKALIGLNQDVNKYRMLLMQELKLVVKQDNILNHTKTFITQENRCKKCNRKGHRKLLKYYYCVEHYDEVKYQLKELELI